MDNKQVMHDCAVAAAQHHLDMVSPALSKAQQKEFHERSYLICKAMLESYALQVNRQEIKLCRRQSRN